MKVISEFGKEINIPPSTTLKIGRQGYNGLVYDEYEIIKDANNKYRIKKHIGRTHSLYALPIEGIESLEKMKKLQGNRPLLWCYLDPEKFNNKQGV